MKKIAVVATVWFPLSHADVIVSRWLAPFPADLSKGWASPRSAIASVYLAQIPENDIGREICRRSAVPLCSSIEDALTLGGSDLAVDAVLLIGEHGDYPMNEYQQKLYPRKQMFDEIARVFRRCGKSAPVFNDKHFSWSFEESAEMLAVSQELGIPLYGGSSIPHCPLVPGFPFPESQRLMEGLALFGGHEEFYGFHIIEFMLSLLERRAQGESGVARVRALRGAEVAAAMASGEISADLIAEALVCIGFPGFEGLVPFVLERTEHLIAFQVEHIDGLRVTYLRIDKWVGEWVAAVRLCDGVVSSCRSDPGGAAGFFGNFAYLNSRVEAFFETGLPPTPVLRTHLTAGILEDLLHGLKEGPAWRDTPRLRVPYQSEGFYR